MGVIQVLVKLSELSKNSNLRLCFTKESPITFRPLIKLLDCLDLFETGSRPKGGIVHLENEDVAISLGGEQVGKDGRIDLSNMPLVPIDYYFSSQKGILRKNDILVCKDGALTGKCCIAKDEFPIEEVMVNEHIYIFRSNEKIIQDFLFYVLRDDFIQFQLKDLAYRKKGQPGLNTDHLALIKLPFFSIPEQNILLKIISTYEAEITNLKNSKLKPLDIINKVFREEFGISLDLLSKLDRTNKLTVKVSRIHTNNTNLRNGTRWSKMQFIQGKLHEKIDCVKVLGSYIKATKNGWSPLSVEYGEGTPILGQEHFAFDGTLKIEPSKFTEETRNNIKDFCVKQGDFFVSRGNTVDLVALASIVKDEINNDVLFPGFIHKS